MDETLSCTAGDLPAINLKSCVFFLCSFCYLVTAL